MLVKNFIMYWWKTWADWYWHNIIMTTMTISIIYFCIYYLHGCTTEGVLRNHMERCKLHRAKRIKLPEAGNKKGCDKVKSTKSEYQLRLFFVVYADFESILSKQDSCEPLSSKSFTTKYKYHLSCSSSICVKCSDRRYFELTIKNMRDDTAEKFLDQVLPAATICRQHLASKIPIKRLTLEQWSEYNVTNCSTCIKPFKSVDKNFLDHDHLTGKHKGAAHNACNLNYRINLKEVKIPCIVHNLKGILFLCYSYFHIF